MDDTVLRRTLRKLTESPDYVHYTCDLIVLYGGNHVEWAQFWLGGWYGRGDFWLRDREGYGNLRDAVYDTNYLQDLRVRMVEAALSHDEAQINSIRAEIRENLEAAVL